MKGNGGLELYDADEQYQVGDGEDNCKDKEVIEILSHEHFKHLTCWTAATLESMLSS